MDENKKPRDFLLEERRKHLLEQERKILRWIVFVLILILAIVVFR